MSDRFKNESENLVQGSLFKVINPDEAFVVMDEHEGFTADLPEAESKKRNFYQRIEVSFASDEYEGRVAQVYILNPESDYYQEDFIINNGLIPSGDWLQFIAGQ